MHPVAINQEIFEFTCSQEELAKSVRHKFVHYVSDELHDCILKIISGQFRHISIRIDKIEIDLGDVCWPEFGQPEMLQKFERDFTQQLVSLQNSSLNQSANNTFRPSTPLSDLKTTALPYAAALKSTIKSHAASVVEAKRQSNANSLNQPSKKTGINQNFGSKPRGLRLKDNEALFAAKQDWELVQAFLITGSLPWWADASKPINLDNIIRRLITRQPHLMQNFLREQPASSPVWRRLATQLKPATQSFIQYLEEVSAPAAYFSGKSNWQKAGFSFPVITFTKEQIVKLKALFQRLTFESADSRKTMLARKLMQLNGLGWVQQAALFDWLPEPEFKKIQTYFTRTRKDKMLQAEEREVLAALQLLTLFQLEFLVYPSALSARPVAGYFSAGTDQSQWKSLHLDAPKNNTNFSAGTDPSIFNPGKSNSPNNNDAFSIPAPENLPGGENPGNFRPGFPNTTKPPIPPDNTEPTLRVENYSTNFLPAVMELPGPKELNSSAINYRRESKIWIEQKFYSPEGLASKVSRNSLLLDYPLPAILKSINLKDLKLPIKSKEPWLKEIITDLIAADEAETTAITVASKATDATKVIKSIQATEEQELQSWLNYSPELPVNPIFESKNLKGPGKPLHFILNKLASPNPAITEWLQQLPRQELHKLKAIFIKHDRPHPERLKIIQSLVQHPALLSYNLLFILANISDLSAAAASQLEMSHTREPARFQKKQVQIVLEKRTKELQARSTAVLNKLSAKEKAVLQDVMRKAACSTQSETSLLRRIIAKLPTESLLFLQFLTELPEADKHLLAAFAESNQEKEQMPDLEETTPKYYVDNAGICLLAPYLPGLFARLQYLENKQFKNIYSATRALQVMQYLVTGQRRNPEYLLMLNKLLIGFKKGDCPTGTVRLTKKEISEADSLLESVIEHWKALRNTSIPGFRDSFLQRKGVLTENGAGWTLQVERKGHDLLLNTIPWGFTLIKLPWMKKMLQVEW